MTERIDRDLAAALLEPPAAFVDRVMAEVAVRPLPAPSCRSFGRRDVLEWLAVAGAVLAGAWQLAAFLFGIWTFTAAV